MNGYRYLHFFAMGSVFFLLISNVAAGKIIDIFGIPAPITVLFLFPCVLIISDVVTEVYGYAQARRIVWYTTIAAIFSSLFFWLVTLYPPSIVFNQNDAYTTVLGMVPRIAFAGIIAVFVGDIANNYVVAKMKVWFSGRYLALRLVSSTIIGQFLNTIVFFVIGLWGVLPLAVFVNSILFATVIKTGIEVLMLPITMRLITFVKKHEGIDVYDKNTDFSPFRP